MREEASLDELLSLWQQEKARGRDLPAAVLCRDRPEMADELERRITAVRRMGALAQAGGPTPVPGPAGPPVLPAAIVSSASLLQSLRQYRLLETAQVQELEALLPRPADAKALAGELVRRGWLTPYQANQLLHGRGRELVLGSYILLERLGEGGMGQVFKARNWKLGRVVALKVIRKDRLANPDAVRRFRREVQAAAALSHPNIVHAYDADEIGGTHLLVMECLEGATDLARLVAKSGPLPVAQATEYVRQAALDLQHAFERGLVHRDIKPQNLLVTADGRMVKILDMGLARLDHSTADAERSSTMTQEGAIMGTPDYIAPEQAMGSHDVDIRADVYSLGCTFYQLLTGQVPFPGGTLMQKLDGHRFHEPKPVEELRPDVPPAAAAVVRKLMAKKPEERYQTPAEVAAALAGANGETSLAVSSGGGTLVDERRPAVPAERTADTVASPFADLWSDERAVAAGPQASRGAGRRRWLLLPAVAGASLVVAGLVFLLVLLLRRGAEPPPQTAAGGTLDAGPPTARAPGKVDDAWLKEVATLPADRQVTAVVAKLKELNPGFDGKETHMIDSGAVKDLVFLSDSVTDISPVQALAALKILLCKGSAAGKGQLTDLSPLRGMQLLNLSVANTKVSDLSPLKEMPLTFLDCRATRMKDLSPLKGMPLTSFLLDDTPVADLSPLKGMQLILLGAGNTQVSDLSPLRDMKLTNLGCNGTQVADLSPLKDMPLSYLMCNGSQVKDLSPLKGMPLEALNVGGTKVSDLSPLKGMPLKNLSCDFKAERDAAILRSIPTLETINGKPTREFWKEVEAKKPE
jgi:tRNA A-37 threonylcarbamoyl transferase component Bud32